MFKFVESLMYLPEEVNIKLVEEIEKEYNLGGERRMGLDGDKSIIWKVLNEKAEKAVFQKGVQEGIQESKLEVAKKLIVRGMEVKEVAEIAELPEEEIKKLMN
ncbi:hypothetical protein M1M88_01705 [Peptococcaceae bacterium]|nr:hypothetical protein [Peptococcaceae bacterium]MCL0052735.1 hypothetical protein [Peptococcaceae bacterium]